MRKINYRLKIEFKIEKKDSVFIFQGFSELNARFFVYREWLETVILVIFEFDVGNPVTVRIFTGFIVCFPNLVFGSTAEIDKMVNLVGLKSNEMES